MPVLDFIRSGIYFVIQQMTSVASQGNEVLVKIVNYYLKLLSALVVVVLLGWGFVEFYSYIFQKTIDGKIEKIERVQINVALLQNNSGGGEINPELYSFAVAIKSADGRIWTASAEDRQWASMSSGICVKGIFFPYPPWRLDKAGTYFGARLIDARECQ